MDRDDHELALPLSAVGSRKTVGVVGAGWAGLAAALTLHDAGHRVVLWEMAPLPGGRGRSGIRQDTGGTGAPQSIELDCGQHILIGAYTASLRLMQGLGVDLKASLWRGPLQLMDAQGEGLRLPTGHPLWAFLRGLWAHRRWSWSERGTLLLRLAAWHRRGFRCEPGLTVAALCEGLAPRVMDELIDPLCVAALNTPSAVADGGVFLRVLGDGLFAGPGGSDLLIPRVPLHELLPGPALQTLRAGGHAVHLSQRVARIEPWGPDRRGAWQVQGKDAVAVDHLILATSAPEAARLVQPWDPAWSATAACLPFAPIVTTWVQAPGARLPGPMVRLDGGPAQFAFDLQALGVAWPGVLALVSSDAGSWLSEGLPALEGAALQQVQRLPGVTAAHVVRSVAERRATFRCSAGLLRPAAWAAPAVGGLAVAGDYVEGPYPSTLEGAVRAGVAAAHHLMNS